MNRAAIPLAECSPLLLTQDMKPAEVRNLPARSSLSLVVQVLFDQGGGNRHLGDGALAAKE
jgi:hypothetical protein